MDKLSNDCINVKLFYEMYRLLMKCSLSKMKIFSRWLLWPLAIRDFLVLVTVVFNLVKHTGAVLMVIIFLGNLYILSCPRYHEPFTNNVCINVKMTTFLICFKYSKVPVIVYLTCSVSDVKLVLFKTLLQVCSKNKSIIEIIWKQDMYVMFHVHMNCVYFVLDQRVISCYQDHVRRLLEESPDWPVVVVATTSHPTALSSDMHEGFLHCVTIEVDYTTSVYVVYHFSYYSQNSMFWLNVISIYSFSLHITVNCHGLWHARMSHRILNVIIDY